jgi:hypothetical protein
VLIGFEVFVFNDGIVRNDGGGPLIDVCSAIRKTTTCGMRMPMPTRTTNVFGWYESRDPSAFRVQGSTRRRHQWRSACVAHVAMKASYYKVSILSERAHIRDDAGVCILTDLVTVPDHSFR